MRPKQPHWLTHPLFLVSLFLLLLNDLSLKYVFHNEFTGKLSDFAGLIVLPMFLFAFFPQIKNRILIATGLLFCFWKSPLSTPLIELMNSVLPFTIARVVDYSDLLALITLPILYLIKQKSLFYPATHHAFILRFLCIVSLFAFCHTSVVRSTFYEHPPREVSLNQYYYTKQPIERILTNLDPDKNGWRKDTALFYELSGRHDYYYRIRQADSTFQWQKLINSGPDTMLYVGMRENMFYTFKGLTVDDLDLKDIRMRFSPGAKRNSVAITTFNYLPRDGQQQYLEPKQLRKIKRYFGRLIAQGK